MPDAQASSRQVLPEREAKVGDAVARLLDAVQLLVREHLELARAEMKQDARSLGRHLALAALGVPAVLAGWILAMTALALALPMPHAGAFGVVAALNVGGGLALSAAGLRKARREDLLLRRSREELRRDRARVGPQ